MDWLPYSGHCCSIILLLTHSLSSRTMLLQSWQLPLSAFNPSQRHVGQPCLKHLGNFDPLQAYSDVCYYTIKFQLLLQCLPALPCHIGLDFLSHHPHQVMFISPVPSHLHKYSHLCKSLNWSAFIRTKHVCIWE